MIAEVSAGINTAPHEPVSRGAMRALIDSTHHYIRNGDGVEELYAWRSDVAEAMNLAARPEARDAVARITVAARAGSSWALFALVGGAMVVYGVATALGVHWSAWRPQARPVPAAPGVIRPS